MRLNRHIAITAAMIISSNIPETVADAAAYAAGTTYALGAVVSVAAGYDLTFYESLQAANTGNTPASSPTWWQPISTGYLAWSSGTAYVVGDRCTYASKLYECLINHTNAQPDINSTGTTPKWMDCGASNRHRAFDAKSSSQASRYGEITYVIVPGALVDTITILDMDASEVEITMDEPVDGEVYHEIFNLVNNAAVVDAYTYFFAPIISQDAIAAFGVPAYSTATITITIRNPGGAAKVGTVGIGLQKYLGEAQFGASFRIVDYSGFETNVFGDTTVIERGFSKKIECDICVSGGSDTFDDINKTLASLRATTGIWVPADEGYASLMTLALCRDFSTVAEGPGWSILRVTLLGLS